ncbi:hypothetical protein L1887_46822 [Cichorium endivia]|nr:hypothetical protein L1887_46822 [Cichorium endivia]
MRRMWSERAIEPRLNPGAAARLFSILRATNSCSSASHRPHNAEMPSEKRREGCEGCDASRAVKRFVEKSKGHVSGRRGSLFHVLLLRTLAAGEACFATLYVH